MNLARKTDIDIENSYKENNIKSEENIKNRNIKNKNNINNNEFNDNNKIISSSLSKDCKIVSEELKIISNKIENNNVEKLGKKSIKQKHSAIFKTIGDVSSELSIPPHVLRFWEGKFLDIKPHKRKGGHRYYSESDVQAIKEVKFLLYDKGFTIKGAKKFLKDKKQNKIESDQQNLFGEVEYDSVEDFAIDNLVSNQLSGTISNDNKNLDLNSLNSINQERINHLINELESIKKLLS